MKQRSIILLLFFLSVSMVRSYAQELKVAQKINLITNGDFEDGNTAFYSEYQYNFRSNIPGQYSVTDNAEELNRDFRNPIGGDHTFGNGYYLVANSDGEPGKKVWVTEVTVLPNSEYTFSVYYCNLYYKLPSKTSFAFADGDVKGNDPTIKFAVNGKQVGELDRDSYHLFRWIYTTATWYSGNYNGKVKISIENENYNEEGNDLAIDDIEFSYLRTMPDDYVPPAMRTIMSEEYRLEMAKNYKPSRRVISFADLEKGDELSPGVYRLKYRSQDSKADTSLAKVGEKFQLHNLIFNQGEPEITSVGKLELDRLSAWLINESNVRLRIEGHTDNQGKQELNLALSEQRVYNVKRYLMEKGIAEDRLETIAYGGALPIADNTKAETRKLNRRVEFEVVE